MVLLRRLAYPSRWCDLVSLFGRTEPELSMIFNAVSKCVHSLLCISEIIVQFCAICLCQFTVLCFILTLLHPFFQILDDLHYRFGHLLQDLELVWLEPGTFAEAIHSKGAPLKQCFGFVDGTVRQIARPIVNQRIMYSGHKRVHCIKFQVCCLHLCRVLLAEVDDDC